VITDFHGMPRLLRGIGAFAGLRRFSDVARGRLPVLPFRRGAALEPGIAPIPSSRRQPQKRQDQQKGQRNPGLGEYFLYHHVCPMNDSVQKKAAFYSSGPSVIAYFHSLRDDCIRDRRVPRRDNKINRDGQDKHPS
jgi:hypothetical protein